MADFINSGVYDVDMSVDNRELIQTLDRLVYAEIVKTNDVRKAFRKVMAPVKKAVVQAAKGNLPNDPRKSYKAVRVITLKKGAGAVVGLLNPRKAGPMLVWRPKRGGKSGIVRHRKKSRHTSQTEAYQGRDRAWLLRIVELGNFRHDRIAGKRGTLKKTADRGDILGKKFFKASEGPMRNAERELAKELGELIKKTSK